MTQDHRPYRSVLYIPASNIRALDKARSLPVDAIIFDLEDAVTPDQKDLARETLVGALDEGGYGRRALIVRINALDTPWGESDAVTFSGKPVDGILLPKVNGPEQLDALDALNVPRPLWAMMETATGVLNAAAIARHRRLAGFVMGTNDLAKELGCRTRPDRAPLWTGLQTCLLAARAAGILCIDGVYNAFRDQDGLRRECEQGRDFGFDGKTLIHPAQVAVANEVFAPSPSEVDLARRQIEAFEKAQVDGNGVAVVDGSIVENLHVETARATLARALAIAEKET